MITFEVASFMEGLPELQPILPIHYEELALDIDKVPLSPQWDVYEILEENGELMYITAREDGELIGYFIGIVKPSLHYSTCLTCMMDIFYIHPEHRGSGFGYKLFEFVKKEVKRRGVDRWVVGSKVKLPADWLFERLGFEKIETFYSMWTGD